MFDRLFFYVKYSFPFFVLRKEISMILGLVITERCNLSCKCCRVSNTGRPDLTMRQILNKLRVFYRRGFRGLYIEGGEPFLWGDGKYTLNDVIGEAKKIGYFHVHVFTNGLFPLKCRADVLWVSVDGLRRNYAKIRGDHFGEVIKNIREATHPKIGIVYTINTINRGDVENFLRFVKSTGLKILGVEFYFHTPYYGFDELFLNFEERKEIIEEIISHKKSGLAVFNSYAALNALKIGKWKRPNRIFAMTDIEGDYMCCRFRSKTVCEHCSYGHCVEITEAQRLKLSALMNLLKF